MNVSKIYEKLKVNIFLSLINRLSDFQSEIKAFRQSIKIHSAFSQIKKRLESCTEILSRRMLSSLMSNLPSTSTVNQRLSTSRNKSMTSPRTRNDSNSTRSIRIIRYGEVPLAPSATQNQALSPLTFHRNSDCHHSINNLSSLMQVRSSLISVSRLFRIRVEAV